MIFLKKWQFRFWLSFFFVAIDRLLKITALNNFFNPPVKLITGIFQLNLSRNSNIAFSLPLGGVWLEVIISLIILILIYYFIILLSKKNYIKASCFLFIIFGAISNLVDRLKYGYVVDYFYLKSFTVFNLADVMIVIGVACLLFKILKKK